MHMTDADVTGAILTYANITLQAETKWCGLHQAGYALSQLCRRLYAYSCQVCTQEQQLRRNMNYSMAAECL